MINAMTADKIADSIIDKSTKEWWPENQEKHKSRNLYLARACGGNIPKIK